MKSAAVPVAIGSSARDVMSATLLGLIMLLPVLLGAVVSLPHWGGVRAFACAFACATLVRGLLQLLDEVPMRLFTMLSFGVNLRPSLPLFSMCHTLRCSCETLPTSDPMGASAGPPPARFAASVGSKQAVE